MIKIISFDLDGTLVKSTYADLVWLEGLPQIYAQEKAVSVEEAKQYLFQEYDQVSDNREEWYDIAYWFDRFQLHTSWRDLLDRYRYAIEPYPEVPTVIQRLSKHYELIITSNAKREFIETELEETNLRPYFTTVFSSTSDFHKVKKVPEFYSTVCQQLSIHPNELIHIGDHEEFDYKSPQKVGIHAYYLNREHTTTGTYIVPDLQVFEKRLTKL